MSDPRHVDKRYKDNLRNKLDQARQDVLRLRRELEKALRVLDLAYAAGNELARCGISLEPDWPKIQDEAYEAVGEYLYPGHPLPGCPGCTALQATAHYEQHRQDGRGEGSVFLGRGGMQEHLSQPCDEHDCDRTATHRQAGRKVCNAHVDWSASWSVAPAFALDD